jgi:hypothetical protein
MIEQSSMPDAVIGNHDANRLDHAYNCAACAGSFKFQERPLDCFVRPEDRLSRFFSRRDKAIEDVLMHRPPSSQRSISQFGPSLTGDHWCLDNPSLARRTA